MVDLVTPKVFADMFGVTRQTVCSLCRNGELPAYRIGGQWRIKVESEDESDSKKRTVQL